MLLNADRKIQLTPLSERATANNLRYEEYLALLLEEEVKKKTESSVRAKISKSRLPYQKTLEEFDFSYQPSLKEKEVIKSDRYRQSHRMSFKI